MRGLTAEEYATIQFAQDYPNGMYPESMWSYLSPLIKYGRLIVTADPDNGPRSTQLSDAGRSALKIHRALMAMEGLGV